MTLQLDKIAHVGAGALAAAAGVLISLAAAAPPAWHLPAGAAACLAAAAGREAYNRWGPPAARTGWDWIDLLATLLGGAAVLGVAVAVSA